MEGWEGLFQVVQEASTDNLHCYVQADQLALLLEAQREALQPSELCFAAPWFNPHLPTLQPRPAELPGLPGHHRSSNGH